MPDVDDQTEALPAPAEHVAPGAAAASLIGRTLGKFKVAELLGRGGSGEVYRAEQPQLGRSAVIKVLHREITAARSRSANKIERFLREAKLASRLDHPYAAHVYAFGAEADGLLWIAMEHVRGATLDEIVARRGAMPSAVFGPLFARICEVVHTAHELGIVHRDIKGSNVMVIERAGQLLPKLLDFGIAKGLDGGATPGAGGDHADPALTGQGSTLGSPHYMAPEQWEAPAGVDARADIYALGVLAYRCVSGYLPFRGIERAGLAQAHLTMPPPPLPDHVATPVADAIARAMAKPREARWPDAIAFGEAVRAATGDGRPAREAVPIFDPATREIWERGAPQPLADAIARLARAATTVEADAALRELVAITCRWLAVLGLAQLHPDGTYADVRECARAVVGRDDAAPWLRLARAAAKTAPALPGLDAALASATALEELARRLDDRDRTRTAAALALDITAIADALQALEPLLAYQLVVGRAGAAESWQGARRRDREHVVVWGEPLADGEVALLDAQGRVVSRLSPLVQVVSPLPSAEPELFLLWRSGRGAARLVAAPWGFERDDEAAAARLSLLTTEDSDTLANEGDDSSPYPGLAAYGVDDAARFVGREREIESLANRLVRAPMVAVLGPSGAGKSSFIHAGLLPRIAENYEIITMRPGRHPLHALAALPPVNGDTEDIAGIAARLRALGERAARGLVIVIDQLEELVTLCADPAERERFAATLAAAADGRSAPVRVVVTLRDDFASIIEAVAAFRGRFEVFVLATPPPEALRRIVTEPARRAGGAVDARVVEDMVAEVAGRPASLPLLSFTASQLWSARDRQARKITHEAYVALGGVAGALTTYADTVYESLARRDQEVVRDLFSRLVSADGTRIPAPRVELEQIAGAAGVLAHLIDARLLVVREDDGVDVVEIVHECLATRWDRLARWRSEDAADRALLGDVRAAARRWREAGQRADLLWRGEALAELRKLTTRSTALTETERAFATEADRAERRSRKVRRALVISAMGMLGAVAIVMAYLGLAANRSRTAAERSAGEAQIAAQLAEDRLTTSLIAQGRRELNDGRALTALAYFGEAMRRGADSVGLRFMVSVASRGWPYQLVSRHDSMISAVASSAKGTWIATADQTARIQFWNTDGTQRAQLATELGWINSLTRTPDDRVLAAGRDGIAVVDPGAPRIVHRIKPTAVAMTANAGPASDEIAAVEEDAIRIYGFDGKVRRSLAITNRQAAAIPIFDPTGRHMSVTDGDVISFDLVKMTSRVLARDIEGVLGGTADGRLIGYVDKKRLAHVLTGDGRELRTFKPEVAGHSLIFSDDGERIGVLSEHDLVIHDASGKWLHGMLVKPSIAQYVVRGDETWIAGADGVLLHYREGQLVASIPHHLGDTRTLHVASNLALTVGDNGSLAISRADAAQLELVPRPCKRASFSGDGIAVTYTCDKEHHVYVGRRHIGTVHGTGFGFVAVDVASGRGAVSEGELTVFEATRPVAKATEPTGHLGSLGFEDRDHLLVAEPEERFGVWRWTIGTDRWDHVIALAGSVAVTVGTGGIFVGTLDGDVVRVRDGRELGRVAVGARVTFLVASGDRRWLAATLVDGTTAVLDGETGALVRRLEPADALVTAAVLDQHGDLLIRSGRGTMTVWDRATGEALVFTLDLLGDMTGAAWSPDGRIELAGRQIGILDIKRDGRPPTAIVEDIACRVAVRVREGKLEPAPPVCPPPAR